MKGLKYKNPLQNKKAPVPLEDERLNRNLVVPPPICQQFMDYRPLVGLRMSRRPRAVTGAPGDGYLVVGKRLRPFTVCCSPFGSRVSLCGSGDGACSVCATLCTPGGQIICPCHGRFGMCDVGGMIAKGGNGRQPFCIQNMRNLYGWSAAIFTP